MKLRATICGLALGLLLLLALPVRPAAADSIALTSASVPLNVEDPAQTTVGRLVYRGGLRLEAADRRFGGLSALDVSPDGRHLLALTDQGNWFSADLLHDPGEDRLSGAANGRMGPLLGLDATPLSGKRASDAEGMARLIDGQLLVSFERRHRIWRYAEITGPAREWSTPPGIAGAPRNGGLEALVALGDGRILAFAEDQETEGGTRAYLREPGGWHDLTFRRVAQFKPTGAARLPNGDIVTVERSFSRVGGIAIRIGRIAADSIRPGARLESTELAIIRPPLTIDNMEGISARRGANGETLIYMVSDDNFNPPLQQTILLLFEVTGD